MGNSSSSSSIDLLTAVSKEDFAREFAVQFALKTPGVSTEDAYRVGLEVIEEMIGRKKVRYQLKAKKNCIIKIMFVTKI